MDKPVQSERDESETRRFELVYPLCVVEYNSNTSQSLYNEYSLVPPVHQGRARREEPEDTRHRSV